MKKKIAMIPMICPLYRLFVWEKMNGIDGFEFDFFLENENNLNNIKYIPKSILDESFSWYKVKNRYYKGICFWQTNVFKTAFKKYDALIMSGNMRCFSTWLTALTARLMGKRVYFWSHGIYGKESPVLLLLKRIFFSIPNGNFFYGEKALERALNLGFDENKNHVIYNSLDYDTHKSKRNKLVFSNVYKNHFENDNAVLLFIGRLTPQKKLNQFLEAVKNIETDQQNINIVFIGDGTQKENLENQAGSLDLNTWFYGECYSEDELSNLIYEADICISPGNVGLTVIHSLSYGTPVITHSDFAFQMPEAEAILPKINGDFFIRDSVSDLSKTIADWLSNDTLSRNQIRENCYRIIDDKYNPYFQANLIKDVISNDLRKH